MLDLIDKKILSTLDMNSRITISQLAKKIRLNRDTTNYRLQKLIREKIIKKFTAQIDATKLGFEIYKIFFKFQNINQKEKNKLYEWLIKNEFIYWIAECRGRWDCNITIFAKDRHHFDEIHTEFINIFGQYVAEQEFNLTLEVGALQKNWKLTNQKRELRKIHSEKKENITMDQIDMKILKILADNCRLKTTEISQKIGVSERVIRYRIKNLEERKVIVGYTISLDYKKIGKQFFKALIELNVCSKELKNRIRTYCKSRPNIIYYIFCIGSWPLELEFSVDNNEEYYEEMEKIKETIPEIKGYETIIFPKEYKFEWLPSKDGDFK